MKFASLAGLFRRVPIGNWCLVLLATVIMLVAAGVLDRVPTYRASIGPAPGQPGSVILIFYGKRFDYYRATGKLEVPPDHWTVTRAAEYVRLAAQPGAAPIQFTARGHPLYVSLIRHAGGGVAAVDSEAGARLSVDLRGQTEGLESLQIGGPASAVPASGTGGRMPLLWWVGLGAVILLMLGVTALVEAARKHAPAPRQAWADLCRVLAIFGVVLIHASGKYFYQYGRIPQGDWLAAAFLDSVVRCAVPLFVMLSGSLLLQPGAAVPGPGPIARRVRKVLVPLAFWGVAHLLYVALTSGRPVDWRSLLTQAPMYHLWFVYMIIGIYLVLPVLQATFNAIHGRRDLQAYLFALWLLLTCVPLYVDVPLLGLLQQTSLLGYGGYFVLGALLGRVASPRPLRWLVVYAASVLVTFGLTWYLTQRSGEPSETGYLYFSLNVVVASIAAFILLARLQPAGRLAASLQWISDRSFLVFFMHVVVLEHVGDRVAALGAGWPMALTLVLVALVTFVICLAIASVLRLVPKSREVIG